MFFFKETTECREHNIAYPDDSSLYLHFHHTPIQDKKKACWYISEFI